MIECPRHHFAFRIGTKNSVSFSLQRRNPPESHRPFNSKKIPRKTNLGWEAMGMRADTEQQKRRDTVLGASERMLGCDGIRRGAYDLVESHHARGACALVRLLFEKGSSKVYDYSTTIGTSKRLDGFSHWFSLPPTKENQCGLGVPRRISGSTSHRQKRISRKWV